MKKIVSEKQKQKIRKRVQRDFPGSKALQDIHFYRYIKEIEWQTMSTDEIVKDIKSGANNVTKEMKSIAS